jgi:hypothetical protein
MLAPGVKARDTAERETPARSATCLALAKALDDGLAYFMSDELCTALQPKSSQSYHPIPASILVKSGAKPG